VKRFHVHLSVENLADSIRFYSAFFGAPPTVEKTDYAKWMVEDPRLNFAISRRGHAPGLNHLGLQVDSGDELAGLREAMARASLPIADEPGAACCYAKSDKHWVTDPQGIAWESYHTLGDIPTFGDPAAGKSACCAPQPVAVAVPLPAASRGCCA
jgi:catechol 2,3-dioxygenase-like lactoylglutathione lyase family enzyme